MKCFEHEGHEARIVNLEKRLEETNMKLKDFEQSLNKISTKKTLYIAILSFLGVVFSTFGSLAGTIIANCF